MRYVVPVHCGPATSGAAPFAPPGPRDVQQRVATAFVGSAALQVGTGRGRSTYEG
jgi:hypothetical protein